MRFFAEYQRFVHTDELPVDIYNIESNTKYTGTNYKWGNGKF